MQNSYVYDEDTKGRYFRLATGANGQISLKPVKVPAHVIEERKRQAREREIALSVQKNRERASRMNLRAVLLMTMAMVVLVAVCTIYITMQRHQVNYMNTVASLQAEIQELTIANDDLASRNSISSDLSTVKTTASEDLGMTEQTNDQIRYYSVKNNDFVLQYSEVDD